VADINAIIQAARDHLLYEDFRDAIKDLPMEGDPNEGNATFHAFKTSGKWGYTSRGVLDAEVFNTFNAFAQYEAILKLNGDCWPGMNGRADGYITVAIPDEACTFGWPLIFLHGVVL
jgi:hypothetical protein